MTKYAPPLRQLLDLGEPDDDFDYPALGIGQEHIPDLIRMALDEDLHRADSDTSHAYAPVHAWRTLGYLRAQAAIEPMLGLFRRIDEEQDDWVGEDLPEAYGMIGPAAIPALVTYMGDRSHGVYARVGASTALEQIGKRNPESRDKVVAVITNQLEQAAENHPSLNGCLLAALLDFRTVESAPVIERAFAANAVDEMAAGDWEDVQVELGLKAKRSTPKPPSPVERYFGDYAFPGYAPPPDPDPNIDALISQMRAQGLLKTPAQPDQQPHKKKNRKNK